MVDSWETSRLGDIALIKGGKRLPKGEKLVSDKTEFPYIRVTDFKNHSIAYDKLLYLTKEVQAKISRYIISKEDVYISIAGTIGLIGKVPTFLDGCNLTENAAKITGFNSTINQDFLVYVLTSDNLQSQIESFVGYGAQPKLSLARINKLKIPIPPLHEQKKIATILSTVDEAIQNVKAQIERTKELKKGLMQQLFSEGIGHMEFKESKLGRIPKEWEVVKISDLIAENIISKVQDGNHGEIHPKSSDFVEEGIPFVMSNNIRNGKLNLSNCHYITMKQACALRIGFSKTGDVLLTHKGSVGLTAIVPHLEDFIMLTPQVTMYRIAKQDKLNPKYLKYFFDSPDFQKNLTRLSMQSTRAYIGITAQKQLRIRLPSIKEQLEIVKIISSMDDTINNQSEVYQFQVDLKKGLMQKLLTGEVRVKINE